MSLVEIVVKVPEEYIRDAEDFGMLDAETIAQVLRDELDARIMQFVDAEVKAYRAEQRAKQASGQAE
jgi:hypothetical protein